MSFEECLCINQTQMDRERDITIYFKGMLAFFWLISFSKKTKAEVAPILESYHTVDRIEKTQDLLNPKIDVKVAREKLAVEASSCVKKHPWLKILYALQTPPLTTFESALTQGSRDYYDKWLIARNEHIKG